MALLNLHLNFLFEHAFVIPTDAHVGVYVLVDLVLVCQCESCTCLPLACQVKVPLLCGVEADKFLAQHLLLLQAETVAFYCKAHYS